MQHNNVRKREELGVKMLSQSLNYDDGDSDDEQAREDTKRIYMIVSNARSEKQNQDFIISHFPTQTMNHILWY